NFSGKIMVRCNVANGIEINASNNILLFHFPSNGLILLKNEDPVHTWHPFAAMFEDGKPVPIEGMPPGAKDGEIALRDIGSPRKDEQDYVIGTLDDVRHYSIGRSLLPSHKQTN